MPDNPQTVNELTQLVLALSPTLLDWPALGTVLVLVFFSKFHDQLQELLSRGDIKLAWGAGKSIELRELPENLDKNIQPLQDELEGLKLQVQRLISERDAAAIPSEYEELVYSDEEDDQPLASASVRIREALSDSRFRWRSASRLAEVTGVTEADLESDPHLELDRDNVGNKIVRLKRSQEPQPEATNS